MRLFNPSSPQKTKGPDAEAPGPFKTDLLDEADGERVAVVLAFLRLEDGDDRADHAHDPDGRREEVPDEADPADGRDDVA